MSTNSIEDSGTRAADWERTVRRAVRALQYGSVEIVVHDGRVVQIETRERVRFTEQSRRTPDHRVRESIEKGQVHRTTGAEAIAEETVHETKDQDRKPFGRRILDDE